MSKEDNFDEEILRYFEPLNQQLRQLQERVTMLEGELAAHEKRELLRVRVRNNPPCRVCNSQMQPPDPPISKAEQTFCEANHGGGAYSESVEQLEGGRGASSGCS